MSASVSQSSLRQHHAPGRDALLDARLDQMHAEMCKVFTSPVRVRILNLLREREMSVGDLADVLGLSQPTVSKHLQIMRSRGIVAARKERTTVYCRLARPKVIRAFDLIRSILQESLEESVALARRAGER